MVRLSLIVCTYRRAEQVRALLQSVARQTRLPDETLIVDASPDSATADMVGTLERDGLLAGLRYEKAPPEHRGLTRQRNYGIALLLGPSDHGPATTKAVEPSPKRSAGGDFSEPTPSLSAATAFVPGSVAPPTDAPPPALTADTRSPKPETRNPLPSDVIAFLDDDTILEPGYFAELLACFERHPDAVGIGGYIADLAEWRKAPSATRRGVSAERKAQSGKGQEEREEQNPEGGCLPAEAPAQAGPQPPPSNGLTVSRLESTTTRDGCMFPASRSALAACRLPLATSRSALAVFRWGDWERDEDFRWRWRKRLGLGCDLPPGWIPRHGHGRPLSYYPPDGQDYRVEFIMGGVSCWKRSLFGREQFGTYFEGYGLYEDMDFAIRAARCGSLYLCTAALLEHHHALTGRPRDFRYGAMVVRNGWYVWRQRWPQPPRSDRVKWWAVTLLLALCRLGNVCSHGHHGALPEACGRFWGMLTTLVHPPAQHPSTSASAW